MYEFNKFEENKNQFSNRNKQFYISLVVRGFNLKIENASRNKNTSHIYVIGCKSSFFLFQ